MAKLQDEMIEFRAKHSLSQEKAATLAGITKQTWYSIENGHQTPSKVTEVKIRRTMREEVK